MQATMLTSRLSAFRSSAPRTAIRNRSGVKVHAAARPLWLPGASVPSYLDGSRAGDYGFDPLKLGEEPGALRWYTQAEIVHCRWSMLGAAGIIIPAALTKAGILSTPEWFESGKIAQDSSSIPFATLLVIEHILLGFVEMKRLQDFRKPGSQAEAGSFLGFESNFKGKEVSYPGGVFDPFGFSRGSEEGYKTYKVKEIANGRLAMLACLGFVAQYSATGKGPIDNLVDHLADPWSNNFATNGVSVPFL